jgi:hypothetical protein
MAGTEFGRSVACAYASRKSIIPEAYLEARYGPPMTPSHVGEQVADIIADPKYRSGVAYSITADKGPLGLDA